VRTGPANVLTGFDLGGHIIDKEDILPASTSPALNPAKEGRVQIANTRPPGGESLINQPGKAHCASDISGKAGLGVDNDHATPWMLRLSTSSKSKTTNTR